MGATSDRTAIAEDKALAVVHCLQQRKLPLAMSERTISFTIHFVSGSLFSKSIPGMVPEADRMSQINPEKVCISRLFDDPLCELQ
jgi:hypothetical protein